MNTQPAILSPRLTRTFMEHLKRRSRATLGTGRNVSPGAARLERMLNEALDAVAREVRPKVMYRMLPVRSLTGKSIRTDAGAVKSVKLARLAQNCRGDVFVVFVIATLGEAFEDLYRRETSLSGQFIIDAVGSECAELVTDGWNNKWNSLIKRRGHECSLRFSPGYCDWKLEGQTVIFGALDADAIGVTLTKDYLMIPAKSISAVALAAKKVPAAAPCAFCRSRSCPWRRMEFTGVP
ncbi:MAG: hypothetical protein NT072_04845 [Deltaproteobacteria bacterium]|nr:hypothetical protein [Deltaproteobacteria bacterium]